MKITIQLCLLLIVIVILHSPGCCQELEPRSLANLPVGTNFILTGYGFAKGNVLMDPSLPIEDMEANLHTFFGAYVRSINLFGLSSKVDVILPFATGDWYYNYKGINKYDQSNGFGDLRVRLSLNFIGGPALNHHEFKNYKQKTVVGYIGQVIIPIGSYKPEQLPNLGSNRWAFRNQLGVSHTMNKWIIEGYVALWLFTANTNYLNENILQMKPISGFKAHLIRLFKKGKWLTFDAGYAVGGTTELNGKKLNNHMSTFRFGLTYAQPLGNNHTIKFAVVSGFRIEQGPDFDAVVVSYQFRWFDNRKGKII